MFPHQSQLRCQSVFPPTTRNGRVSLGKLTIIPQVLDVATTLVRIRHFETLPPCIEKRQASCVEVR